MVVFIGVFRAFESIYFFATVTEKGSSEIKFYSPLENGEEIKNHPRLVSQNKSPSLCLSRFIFFPGTPFKPGLFLVKDSFENSCFLIRKLYYKL